MRRRDGGAGRRRDRRTGPQIRRSGAREIRAFDRCGARVPGSQPAHGRRRGSARGRYPPARSWLTEAGPAFLKVAADVLARKAGRSRTQRGPTSPEKRGPTPEGERRSRAPRGAPVGDPAGHLGRSRDGSYREAGHGCGVPHQRLSALCPLIFFREEQKKTKGHPPPPNGPAERWLLRVIPGPSETRSPESITTGQENGTPAEQQR